MSSQLMQHGQACVSSASYAVASVSMASNEAGGKEQEKVDPNNLPGRGRITIPGKVNPRFFQLRGSAAKVLKADKAYDR